MAYLLAWQITHQLAHISTFKILNSFTILDPCIVHCEVCLMARVSFIALLSCDTIPWLNGGINHKFQMINQICNNIKFVILMP